ncbi:MAG: family 10 glycosylhydrolase [Acidobacteria bacterium]|nr:family 10 glycosylhydrolase [Acidobacteriota bacterium]
MRALWVTRSTLTSADAIAQLVRVAKAGGFNALLVQVRGRGDAYYRSTLEPRAAELAGRPDFDPLQQVITAAHAAGLQVHAWVAVNLVSSAATLPAARDHIVYRNPEWLMVPRALAAELRGVDVRSPEYLGRLARWTRARNTEVEGLYASPLHPGAAAHVAAVVKEMVTTYPLDGVHLDYVRFPGPDYDFSRSALQQFKQAVQPELSAEDRRRAASREPLDPFAYPNLFPERWEAFRRSRLTSLVMRVRTAVRAARPDAIVSAAVIPDAEEAFNARLQDWRTWLDQSLIDVLCPMAYTTDARTFERQITLVRDYAGGHMVWAGIGAYRLSPADTVQFIAASRRLGTSGTALFSYDALVAPPHTLSTLTDLGRAAFGAGSH